MSIEDLKISQLPEHVSGSRSGKYAITNPTTERTEKIGIQEGLGAIKADFAWQTDTTYADGDYVEYQNFVWESLVGSNTGNVPSENTFWTNKPISDADGITDTQWAAGMFTYDDSKMIYLNAQYYLQVPAPYESTDAAAEIIAGDWSGPSAVAQDTVQFIPQSPDPTHQEGVVFYDEGQKAFSWYNDIADVKMTSGREQWKRGINKTGGALSNGQIVKSGPVDVVSDQPTVLLVGANDVDVNDTLGFLTHDVDDGDECEVTTFGDLHDIDTIGYTEGTLYMSTTPGEWTNTAPDLPSAVVSMGRFEKIHATDGRIFVTINPPQLPLELSFNPSFSSFATGTQYVTGGYLFGASSFTPSGSPQSLGTVNVAHGMHAFLVLGAASTDMIVRVTGTSYEDEDGIRTPGDTIDIDTSGLSVNDYIETPEKWIGQINFTLLSGTAVAVNYGFSKYWDNKNKPFIVTQIEWDGEAGFNDASPDVLFYKHSASGWTYNVAAVPTQAAALASMQGDYVTEFQFSNGLKFNYKKTGLSELVNGDQGEGLITAVQVNNSNSVVSSNFDIKYIE